MPRLRLLPPAEEILSKQEAIPVLNYLMNRGGRLAIDTETTGLDKFRDRVLFWSLATEDRRFCLPWELLFSFDPLFKNKQVSWYLANAKYDMHLLSNMGISLGGDIWDIIPMDAMVDDTRPHGLKEQAYNSYGVKWGDFKDLFLNPEYVSRELRLDKHSYTQFKQMNTGDKLLFVYDERPDVVVDYASCDAYFTYMRGEDLRRQLDSEELATAMVPGMKTLLDYYRVLEVPLTKALWDMEREGFRIDFDWMKKIDGPMRDGLKSAERKVHKAAGKRFNLNSNDELRTILFDQKHFGLNPVKYTAGGKGSEPKPSTDEMTLKILLGRSNVNSPEHHLLKSFLEHRHLKKLHGTYVKKLIEEQRVMGDRNYRGVIGPDGKLHPSYRQAGARTGRLSASDPPIQTIPSRNDEYKIRGGFISDPGNDLIDYDYPQIEFRIAAVLADEQKMVDDIKRGWDIHTANAAQMYNANYEAIMASRALKDADKTLSTQDKKHLMYRNGAKAAGLGIMYGEGPGKLASGLGISYDEALDLIDQFHDTFQNLSMMIDETKDYAHANEYTYTMLGRKRRLYRINNEYSRGLAAAEERQAFNTVIQGSGAEMMKLAILRVWSNEDYKSLGGKLIATVHDELIGQAPKDTAKDAGEVMKEMMADPYRWGPIQIKYPVPVDPDGSIAARWSEAK